MFLPRCNPLGLPGPLSMAGTAMGGMAMLACAGPFLAGVGVGAGIVGGAMLARKAMERRSGWRDDPVSTATDDMPDEGEATPVANPL
jgi:hypothetical protein